MSTQLITPNYLVILPPTQHHSFFRNLPPLFGTRIVWSQFSSFAQSFSRSVTADRERVGYKDETGVSNACSNLVPRGRDPFGQRRGSGLLAGSNTGSPQFTDFLSLCACPESSLTNLIGSGLNLLCLQSFQNRNVVGPGQRSRFPAHDKRDPRGRGCATTTTTTTS